MVNVVGYSRELVHPFHLPPRTSSSFGRKSSTIFEMVFTCSTRSLRSAQAAGARAPCALQILSALSEFIALPLAYFAGFPVVCFGDVFRKIIHAGLSAATLSGFTSDYIFSLVVFDRADIHDAAPLFVES